MISNGHFSQDSVYDRILYVAPRRRDYVIPFNVLARPDDDTETYEIVQMVISAFMRTWSQTLQEPPRFQQIMRAALATLVETGGTLGDLYSLLVDEDFRAERLQRIQDPQVASACRTFFENEFSQWGRERATMINSTTNKVTALMDNPSIANMLGQKQNRLNIRKAMDAGRVVIVDLGDCDDETKRLFGSLISNGFIHAALSRARAPFEERKPYYLYVDEFQDFVTHPGQAKTFSQMLSQVRKFGLHMVLANQSLAQLSPGLQIALGNAQTIVSFRISRVDAEALARVLGKVDTSAIKRENQTETQHPVYQPLFEQWEDFIQLITKLQVRQAVVKTADDREALIWSEKIAEPDCTPEQLESVIVNCLKRHGQPY
ncbi:MAG: TraM recognition domain-containing protein, partial [Chloroflexi bacterium]|nr:TraM recognition domain-containing protein [Chloroflexota bacterium]